MQKKDNIAMDRNSVRRIDEDGHMRVEITPISAAVVSPYYGREIPGYQALGLDPEKIYQLYRDAEALKNGAASFKGKPLMLVHQAINADDHPRNVVIGSVGDNVVFEAPFLKAPLTIWDSEAISLIESGEQRDISCGYEYKPVMVSGAINGEQYDGIMTEIRGNHVALVSTGRVRGAIVADNNDEIIWGLIEDALLSF